MKRLRITFAPDELEALVGLLAEVEDKDEIEAAVEAKVRLAAQADAKDAVARMELYAAAARATRR